VVGWVTLLRSQGCGSLPIQRGRNLLCTRSGTLCLHEEGQNGTVALNAQSLRDTSVWSQQIAFGQGRGSVIAISRVMK
jgi:hypothetical protein